MRSSSRTKRIFCVIQLELGEDQYFLNFHVPVVAYARDQILRDCDGKLTDQDGYVFMTSKSTDIEGQMVPLLKCLSHTTLKIRTKYILDFTEDRVSNETYENYFNNLRKSFGIINMAILPIRDQSTNAELPFNSTILFLRISTQMQVPLLKILLIKICDE